MILGKKFHEALSDTATLFHMLLERGLDERNVFMK